MGKPKIKNAKRKTITAGKRLMELTADLESARQDLDVTAIEAEIAKCTKRINLSIQQYGEQVTRSWFDKGALKYERAMERLRYLSFYSSPEWKALRKEVLRLYGKVCMKCSASASDGAAMHVDHIKPRSLFPSLAMDFDNLQVLCADCNVEKSNRDFTDYRRRA